MSLSIWEVFQALFRWGEGADEEPSEEADEGPLCSLVVGPFRAIRSRRIGRYRRARALEDRRASA